MGQIGLLINIAQVRNFEVLGFAQCGAADNEASGAFGNGVAGIAFESGGVIGIQEGIEAIGGACAVEGGGQREIEILIGVWLKHDGVDEIAVSGHIGG